MTKKSLISVAFVLALMLVASGAFSGSGQSVIASGSSGVTLQQRVQCSTAEHSWGTPAWRYFLRIRWCYDGQRITSVSWTRWGETYLPFWTFAGHVGKTVQGGPGQQSFYVWTKGLFKYCYPAWPTCLNKYQELAMKVDAKGQSWKW